MAGEKLNQPLSESLSLRGKVCVEGARENQRSLTEKFALKQKDGLTVVGATFFVVGEVVGAGIVALPYTMRLVHWFGIPLFFLAAVVMCLCGVLLASASLKVLEESHDPQLVRDPYPRLAERAFGPVTKVAVSVTLNSALLFTCIVFVLLAGEIFTAFAPLPLTVVSYRCQLRMWFVICGVVLLPITLLGTPKDFWGVGFLAAVSSSVAAIMILLNVFMIAGKYGTRSPGKTAAGFETLLATFGTIQFTFGGIAIFPTIQNDLQSPRLFRYSVVIGYAIVLGIYLAVSLSSFVVLDGMIEEDLLTTFIKHPMYAKCPVFRAFAMMAQILIGGHVLCACVMTINPVEQQIEGILRIPTQFCWQRVINRTLTMVVIVTIAIAVPSFGPVLSLVGGSFQALLSVVFPIIFYCKMADRIGCAKELALVVIVIVSVALMVGNGYVEVKNIVKVIQGNYQS